MPSGKQIKEIRKKQGLTQVELGKRCGIADANLRKYENGQQNPKLETLQKIALALNVSVSELLDMKVDTEKIPVFADSVTYEAIQLESKEKRLLKYSQQLLLLCEQLNEAGQEQLIEHAKLLLKIKEYQKD